MGIIGFFHITQDKTTYDKKTAYIVYIVYSLFMVSTKLYFVPYKKDNESDRRKIIYKKKWILV